jgi:very-short-patch-repair endonuclease
LRLHSGGRGGEVELRKDGPWNTPRELWAALKPLAREMRQDPTPAEKALWEQVRDRKVAGAKFRRQHTIDRFIVDFYCAEARLVIEVDGDIHQYTQEEDAIRQEFLESTGLRVLRFSNQQVLGDMAGVVSEIEGFITKDTPSPNPDMQSQGAFPVNGEGESTEEISPSLLAERGPGGFQG